jgi:hypothetical protein
MPSRPSPHPQSQNVSRRAPSNSTKRLNTLAWGCESASYPRSPCKFPPRPRPNRRHIARTPEAEIHPSPPPLAPSRSHIAGCHCELVRSVPAASTLLLIHPTNNPAACVFAIPAAPRRNHLAVRRKPTANMPAIPRPSQTLIIWLPTPTRLLFHPRPQPQPFPCVGPPQKDWDVRARHIFPAVCL